MGRTPPWRWNMWGTWPPESTRPGKALPTHDEIKARAYLLSKVAPWRTATENWEQAERELANPGRFAWLVAIWRWCGFAEKSDKKGLDAWVSLSIPVLVFGGGLLFNEWSGERQREISSEESKDAVLREYTKEMKTMLLDPKTSLEIKKPGSNAHSVARALTLITLSQLQGSGPLAPQRRNLVFQFLREAQEPILGSANLSRYDLSRANLSMANLTEANLTEANLSRALLSRADLSGAFLSRANLSGAFLSRADLSGAVLSRANLSGAFLIETNLSMANLSRANLSEANLSRANLSEANLSRADLSRADLSRADLSRADLSGAKFENTICPDGKKTDTGC